LASSRHCGGSFAVSTLSAHFEAHPMHKTATVQRQIDKPMKRLSMLLTFVHKPLAGIRSLKITDNERFSVFP
jgi:hypothetical protein